jgi:hypothetical protein
VQDYLYNIFMDIVRNYDIDGIHFDYVRLLSSNSGYDPVALAQFQAETGFSYSPASPGALSEVVEAWRRDQISQLVQRVHSQTDGKALGGPPPSCVNFSDRWKCWAKAITGGRRTRRSICCTRAAIPRR